MHAASPPPLIVCTCLCLPLSACSLAVGISDIPGGVVCLEGGVVAYPIGRCLATCR